jgi:hypothetical protein
MVSHHYTGSYWIIDSFIREVTLLYTRIWIVNWCIAGNITWGNDNTC